MSLLSKLLEDLDERQADLAGERDPVLDGLQKVADKDFHARRARMRWILTSTAAALLLLSIVASYRTELFDGARQTAPEPAVAESNAPPAALAQEGETTVPPATPPADRDLTGADTRAEVQFIDRSVEEHDTGATIILRLSGSVEYRIFPAIRQDRVTIDFAAPLTDSAELGLSATDGLVRNLARSNAPPDTTRVIVQFAVPVTIETSERVGSDDTFDLLLSVAPLPVPAPDLAASTPATRPEAEMIDNPPPEADVTERSAPAPVAQPAGQTAEPAFSRVEVSADDIFNKGLQLYRTGKVREGMAELQRALDRDPLHVDARSTLASCLVEQGAPDVAVTLLSEGLLLAPREFTWAELKAHLQVDAGDVNGAIDTLYIELPDTAADPEYHGFLAALLQRENRHQEAAERYRRIVEVRPGNGIWWMGLGISLERVDQPQEAKYAYQQALGDSTLAPDLRGYISKRIISLSSR